MNVVLTSDQENAKNLKSTNGENHELRCAETEDQPRPERRGDPFHPPNSGSGIILQEIELYEL